MDEKWQTVLFVIGAYVLMVALMYALYVWLPTVVLVDTSTTGTAEPWNYFPPAW